MKLLVQGEVMISMNLPRDAGSKCLSIALIGAASLGQTQDASIVVQADQVLHRLSPYYAGACLEDVNHEVYGGIDSQMIFGESLAEPAAQLPLKGFNTYDGRWTLGAGDCVQGVGGGGAKIVWDDAALAEGEVSVDVKLTEAAGGNGGLVLKVKEPANGADAFTGYEVSLERPGFLVLGRHRNNWEPLLRIPCDVPIGEWIKLTVRLAAKSLELLVNGKFVTRYEDEEHPLEAGAVGLRIWQHEVWFRNLSVTSAGTQRQIPFEYDTRKMPLDEVSGMWRPVRVGGAQGDFSLVTPGSFSGRQSQQIVFSNGSGVIGIENQGLNRWGMNFQKGKSYEGLVYARSDQATKVFVALESRDGAVTYAEKSLLLKAGGWQKLDFTLKPNAPDHVGRFAIKLKSPGAVTIGYAFLQPGSWGRFKGLPVRKDVAQGLIEQGVTFLRYGGCMANAEQYRWKNMIGPRPQRPPHVGWWYPYASNGWGIFDFLNFCEAAGFLAIPDVHINESPRDMVDFIEYVNGSADSDWGRRRVADGHPKPYRLKYLQLGNEEQVNENYWLKFKPLAEAIWAKDPDITLIVGDFAYQHQIKDPFNFTGADGRITTLAAHQKILQLAKRHDREVWFDVHIWTDGPKPASSLMGALSFTDALALIADGAKHRVVVFELNANNPAQRRALANALALNVLRRDARIPLVASANCLQPDGQNDNGWDQGLLFLNPTQVWLQPPGYVTKMISENHLPLLVNATINSMRRERIQDLDAVALRSEDGRNLVLQVVNSGAQPLTAALNISGFKLRRNPARVETLTAALDARNTAAAAELVKPIQTKWRHELPAGSAVYTFPAHSFTMLRF